VKLDERADRAAGGPSLRLVPARDGSHDRNPLGSPRLLAELGKVAAVAIPTFGVVAATTHLDPVRTAFSGTVLGLVWYGAVNYSLGASRTTLAVLGPRIAVARGAGLGLLVATVLGAWFPGFGVPLDATFAIAALVFVLGAAWETVVARHLTPPKRLLLIGPRAGSSTLVNELQDPSEKRFELVGVAETIDDLQRIVRATQPDLVALVPGSDRPRVFAELLECADSGFRVLELAQFYEYAFGRVPVQDLTRAWFMSVLHFYQSPYSRFVKRATDLLGVVLIVLLVLPLFPLLSLLVLSTRGPVVLRQTRIGEHGRPFTIYKFRTMYADAERPGQAVWASVDDPRVTRTGRLMRRFRLDELPQVWNVVRGDMSIVGPRPERPEFIEELHETVPFWSRRHLVKPGITGWAQIKRGYTADAQGTVEKLSYDLWYIRHRSLTVDAAICARTLWAALRGDSRLAADGEAQPLRRVAVTID